METHDSDDEPPALVEVLTPVSNEAKDTDHDDSSEPRIKVPITIVTGRVLKVYRFSLF